MQLLTLSVAAALLAFSVVNPTANSMVDVGGFKLHAQVGGSGSCTAVFESGLGEDASSWDQIVGPVGSQLRTLAYDRAGLGKSEPSPNERDAQHIAGELHALLSKSPVPKPYILVGHSLGGYIVRVFAHAYPDEVAGMVFVDPVDERLESEIQRQMQPDQWEARRAAIAKAVGGMPDPVRREQRALSTSGDEAAQAWPLPGVPVALLTGTKKNPQFPGNPLEQDTKLRLHDGFMDRLGRGVHVLVPTSRHYIQNDEPRLVIHAIADIAAEAPRCHALQAH